MQKNLMVAQSGGPTAVINSSLAGVIGAAREKGYGSIYGALYGIEGVLGEKIIDLGGQIDTDEKIRLLCQTPDMFLGSCRYKMPPDDKKIYEKIKKVFKKYKIDTFVYIGGNDSMDTVWKLSDYMEKTGSKIKIVGVPKTIDNDLLCTDHTPGYGSAAKYIATTVSEVISDCEIYDIPAVTIIEIMGRNAGFLSLAAGIPAFLGESGPSFIYLPERTIDPEKVVLDIREKLKTQDTVIVAVSEGVKTRDGQYFSSSIPDAFGHRQLSGAARELERMIKYQLGCKVRSIELNTPQRSAAHIMSECDRKEAYMLGETAVDAAFGGMSGVVPVIIRENDKPYKAGYKLVSVSGVANFERKVPDNFINEEGNFITKEAFDYMFPLIQGEAEIIYENGLPKKIKADKNKLV